MQCVDFSNSAARQRPQMTPMAYHAVRCSAPPTDDNVQPDVTIGSQDWHAVVPQVRQLLKVGAKNEKNLKH